MTEIRLNDIFPLVLDTENAAGTATDPDAAPSVVLRRNGVTVAPSITQTAVAAGVRNIDIAIVAAQNWAPGDRGEGYVEYVIGGITQRRGFSFLVRDTVANETQAGLTAQGYTTTRAPLLANLDASVNSRSTYSGTDTPGTSTLLARVTNQRATNLDNLDASVNSRSTYSGGDTPGTTTLLGRISSQRAINLDNLDALVSSRLSRTEYTVPDNANILALATRITQARAANLDFLDIAVSSRSSHSALDVWNVSQNAAFIPNTLGIKIKNWILGSDNKALLSTDAQTGVTIPTVTNLTNDPAGVGTLLSRIASALTITSGKVDVNDKSGFSLSDAGVKAVWDFLATGATTAGSMGKRIVDNLNATISSRLDAAYYDQSRESDRENILDVLRAFITDNLYPIQQKTDKIGTATVASKADVTVNLPAPIVNVSPTLTADEKTQLAKSAAAADKISPLIANDAFTVAALANAPAGGGGAGGGLTPDEKARLARIDVTTLATRARQNEEVPEPALVTTIPRVAEGDIPSVVIVIDAILGRTYPNATFTLRMREKKAVVLFHQFLCEREFVFVTDDKGHFEGVIYQSAPIKAAGYDDIFILDSPEAEISGKAVRIPSENFFLADLVKPPI